MEQGQRIWYRDGSGNTDNNSPISLFTWWNEFVLQGPDPISRWYKKADSFWIDKKPTVNAMLGGYGRISNTDIKGSQTFLKSLKNETELTFGKAIDIGAGIGRIANGLLTNLFEHVDIMEQNPNFLAQAKENMKLKTNAKGFYCSSMQDFDFPGKYYDIIWIQWVIIYLTDNDMILFLKRAKEALSPNGLIVIKENCKDEDQFYLDTEDNSITRSYEHMAVLFKEAGLTVVKNEIQRGFPSSLIPVKMIALSPQNITT